MASVDSDSELEEQEEMAILHLLQLKKKRIWVHDINKKRQQMGEYHHLCHELESHEDRFYTYFRMSEEHFHEIHDLIKHKIAKNTTNWRKPIGTKERLAICIRYLTTGDSFTTISFSFRVGKSTVAVIVKKISEHLWQVLQPLYLPKTTEQTWRKIELGYRQRTRYPNCLGSIDGKHVYIKCPPNSGSAFYCYKKRYSLIMLAVVDANYMFTVVDVGAYGKDSDNTVFETSQFYRQYILDKEILPPKPLPGFSDLMPHVFLGDEGFALETYLMRPYDKRSANANSEIKTYNIAHNSARRISENAFGILVQKWRVFLRPIECELYTAVSIVKSACCLHNFLRSKNILTLEECESVNSSTISLSCVTAFTATNRRSNMEAFRIRDKFKTYFNLQ